MGNNSTKDKRGISTASFHAAYAGKSGFSFETLGPEIDLNGGERERIRMREVHEYIFDRRATIAAARNELRVWDTCDSARCLAREFERALALRCELKPMSRLLVIALDDDDSGAGGGATALLDTCVIRGLVDPGAETAAEVDECMNRPEQ